MDKINFGSKLKEARIKKGLTQEQFAEMIEMSPKTIWHIESGNKGTTLSALLVMCKALDINPSDLLSADLDTDLKNNKSEYISLFKNIKELPIDDRNLLHNIIKVTIKNRGYYRET